MTTRTAVVKRTQQKEVDALSQQLTDTTKEEEGEKG